MPEITQLVHGPRPYPHPGIVGSRRGEPCNVHSGPGGAALRCSGPFSVHTESGA